MEESRLLVQRVLEHDEIECIEWMATSGNEAGNRSAQEESLGKSRLFQKRDGISGIKQLL